MNAGAPRMMLIDSGAPKSVVSKEWIEGYLKDMKVSEDEIEKMNCCRHFRKRETTYLSEVEIRFPVVLKTLVMEIIWREVKVYIIDADSEFLSGKRNNKGIEIDDRSWKDKQEFKEKDKKVKLIESKGWHLIAQLELVGKWKDKDAIYLVENEDEVNSDKALWMIHKILNHKSKEQMHYVFRNAGKLNEETRKRLMK